MVWRHSIDLLFVFVKSHMTYFLTKRVLTEQHSWIMLILSRCPAVYKKQQIINKIVFK